MIYVIKICVSAILITVISELSKRSSLMGAMLASFPLISILSMLWLYYDTGDLESVIQLSRGVFFLILPSLTYGARVEGFASPVIEPSLSSPQ